MDTPVKAQRLLSYLGDHVADMVAYLTTLARLESPSDSPEAQMPSLNMLAGSLSDLGFHVELLPGRQSGGQLLATNPQAKVHKKSQLLLGHCDTVWPLDTLRTMPVEIDGDKVRGPGVYDMKGGLTQMIYALQALRDLHLSPTIPLRILINSDEEIGSHDSTPQIQRLARAAERVFVLEPALGPLGKIKTQRKGVGRFEIVAKGRAAHAGLDPDKGISAILELSHLIQALFALNDPDRGVTVNVGKIDGGLRPNVVAPVSRALVDVRVLNQQDANRIEQAIHDLKPTTPGVALEITGSIRRPPMEQTPRNRKLWDLAQELGQALGIDLVEGSSGGASDGNTTSQITATLDGLGAVGDGAHAVHEFIYVDKMIERAALLALLMLAPALDDS